MKHVFWLVPGAVAGRAGPDQHPWDANELLAGGIGAVLSVNDGAACQRQDFTALGMSYRCIPLSDNAPPLDGDIDHCLDALPEAYDFVRGELDSRRAVLVHCHSGKDRTGLFMCYFLMRESGISVEDAIKAVRRVRPIALSAEGWERLAATVLKAGSSRAVARC